jgi:CubicO group peptidase (beta-lactamase class C family)
MRTTAVLTVLAAAALFAQPARLPRVQPESVGLDSRPLAEASSLLNQFVKEGKIAGAVASVARHGRTAYIEAVGFQNLETGARMTERSIFRIYSMSKAVTAIGAMALHEEKRFGLDDPVSKYLPEFRNVRVLDVISGLPRPPRREITVADLLLHTSGLSHRSSEMYRTEKVRSRAITLPQFIENIVRAPLMEDPGTGFRYSEATTVVGRLIEIWSGQPLDQFLRNRLFDPLGMVDTGFWATPAQLDRLTMVYASGADGLKPHEIEEVPFNERPALLEGSVGLLSTVPDFMRFAQMLANRGQLDGVRILSEKTATMITANGLSDSILQMRGGGMGWAVANVNVVVDPSRVKDSPNVGEYGWDGTAGTIFWIDPKTEVVTILMTQSVPPNPDALRQRFKALVNAAVRGGAR